MMTKIEATSTIPVISSPQYPIYHGPPLALQDSTLVSSLLKRNNLKRSLILTSVVGKPREVTEWDGNKTCEDVSNF